MIGKAIGYIRVSSRGQAAEGKESLKIQRDDIEQFATKAGYDLAAVYEDQFSAFDTDWHERPGLHGTSKKKGAYLYMQEKGITTLIFSEIPGKRLSRDGVDALVLVRDFERAGIEIMNTKGEVRSVRGYQGVGTFMEGDAGREEIEALVRRAKRTKRAHAKAGQVVTSQPPYGFRKPAGGKPGLEIVKYQAAKVKALYTKYSSGKWSIQRLVDWLNEAGVKTPKAEKDGKNYEWSKATVGRILTDSAYRGQWIYQKSEAVEHGEYKVAPADRHITVKVPQIVSDVVWNKVAEMRGHNRKRLRTAIADNDFPLRGRIRCRNCGYSLTRKLTTIKLADGSRKTYEYYVHNRNKEVCGIKSLKAAKINAYAFDSAYRLIQDPKEVERRLDLMREQAGEINADTDRMIAAAEERLEERREQYLKFLSVEAGPATAKALQDKINNTEVEIESLTREIATHRASLFPVPEVEASELTELLNAKDFSYLREYLGIHDQKLDPLGLPEGILDAISTEDVTTLYEQINLEVEVSSDEHGKNYVLIKTPLGSSAAEINGDLHIVSEDGIHGDWKRLVGRESE